LNNCTKNQSTLLGKSRNEIRHCSAIVILTSLFSFFSGENYAANGHRSALAATKKWLVEQRECKLVGPPNNEEAAKYLGEGYFCGSYIVAFPKGE
jgi:hypothetical protein